MPASARNRHGETVPRKKPVTMVKGALLGATSKPTAPALATNSSAAITAKVPSSMVTEKAGNKGKSETSTPQRPSNKPSLLQRLWSGLSLSARPWQTGWQRRLNKLEETKRGETKATKAVKMPPAWKKLPLPLRIVLFPVMNPAVRMVVLALGLASVLGLLYVLRDLPSPRRLTSSDNFAVSTQIFDRKGKLLYEIYADENRIPIKIDTLPPYVYQASVAIEDQNFYRHFGFDVMGILRAAINNFQGKRLEGGSTITQQLVKNALLSPERSVQRKIKEGILSIATEVIYSKHDILEMYMNYISYGGTSVGIESAARRYFNKSAKDLTLAEAAVLAALPQSPTRYSPFGSNAEEAKQRQHEVLRRMVEDKYITQEQADQAKNEALHFAINKTNIQAPHFVFFVRDMLYNMYGEDRVEKGGLRVTTTLDLDLQNTAQATLSAEVENLKSYKVGNGAALVIKPNTGEILAMIGSKDYFNTKEDGQVNVTLAQRQPGSSVKPLMYATAFQLKLLNPGSYLLDIPTCFIVAGQKPYCPKNYDGTFRGPVNIRTALGNSLNIPAVKALRLIGVENFITQANKMGITSWTDPSQYGLSLTLGGGEVRMIDHAQAFSVLADQGVKVPLTPFLKIEDYRGNVLEQVDIEQRKNDLKAMTEDDSITKQGDLERVMDRAPAYMAAHIMQDNNARTAAFGPKSKLVIPNQVVSVKTGTTNDLKDNWTIGFTPEFLTATWVGNNDSTPMNRSLVSGVTGAAPIWHDIMAYILSGREAVWEEKPDDVTSADVCIDGFPPRPGEPCPTKGKDLYWKLSQPSLAKYVEKDVWIHPDTGLPLKAGESTENLSLQKKLVITDPFTTEFCVDCARPVGEDGKTVYERENITSDSVVSP